MSAYTLACFGLIGTTMVDDGTLEKAYAEAIATQGVVTGTTAFARSMARVHRSRGKSSIDVLRELFPGNEARAQARAFPSSDPSAELCSDPACSPCGGRAKCSMSWPDPGSASA